MNNDVVISVENLWKQYRYGVLSHRALYKDLQSWWARFRGREDPNLPVGNPSPITYHQEPVSDDADHFWALRDINFEVKRGEVLGIIGKNGAGKSTLLKIMSRVTAPTKGQINIKGRVASLLEVGTGFHPELTGRENIFLNGAILGMTKDEIRRKFDEIVAFAEIDKFIDTPVKRYSSGMYVRLAFAVAAHLEPETLVVDEVLAVGDASFQKKCIGKMGDVSKEGRTVLFVSHNMASIQKLCSKSILLDNGYLEMYGSTEHIITHYLSHQGTQPVNNNLQNYRSGWAIPLIESARMLNTENQETNKFPLGSGFIFEIIFKSNHMLKKPVLGIVINHPSLGTIGGVNMRMTDFEIGGGPHTSGIMRCIINRLPLLQGYYTADIWLGDGENDLDCLTGYLTFEVIATDIYKTGKQPFSNFGTIYIEPIWEFMKLQ
jgi:lipopolysaccharide transport system ATP-binding protein